MIAAEHRSYAYSPGIAPAPEGAPGTRREVRPRKQSGRMTRADFTRWLAALVVLGALGTGATAASSAVAAEGYRVDRLNAALQAATTRQHTLQLEEGRAESLAGIRQRAASLGMRRPDAYQMVNPVPVHAAPRPLGRTVTVVLPAAPVVAAQGRTSPLASVRGWLQRLAGRSAGGPTAGAGGVRAAAARD